MHCNSWVCHAIKFLCLPWHKVRSRWGANNLFRNICRCAPCHSSCATCSGSNSSQCVSCATGHFWHDGSCVKDCPAHHYADPQQHECIECPPGCSECNKTTCISCLDDWQINSKGRCVPHGSDKCDIGKYYFISWRLSFNLFLLVNFRWIFWWRAMQTLPLYLWNLWWSHGTCMSLMFKSSDVARFSLCSWMHQGHFLW